MIQIVFQGLIADVFPDDVEPGLCSGLGSCSCWNNYGTYFPSCSSAGCTNDVNTNLLIDCPD